MKKSGLICTGSTERPPSGLIIIEDLSDQNRETGKMIDASLWDKTKLIDIKVAKLVLEKMAIIHGICMVWFHDAPDAKSLLKKYKNTKKILKFAKLDRKQLGDVQNILK